MWATIIIAESFTRIMGSAAGNTVYYRRRRFLQYNFMDPGWGARISYGGPGRGQALAPSLAPALYTVALFRCSVVP